MMREMAGIVDAASGCLAGITCQHAIVDTAKPALDEIATLLTATAGKLRRAARNSRPGTGTAASPILHAGRLSARTHGPPAR